MNKKISGLITDWCSQFISIEAISSVISYGIEVWLNSIVKIILLVLIGGICGFFKETILVLFIFGQVRKYAGGVHCKTDVGCFFSMLFICLISIGVSKNSEKIPLFFIVIVLISIWISTLKYAPCNSKVNPITDEILLEKKRKGAILIITGVSILIIFLPVKEWKWLILCPVFIEVLTILPFMERRGVI